jgi:hypothetical protein
MEEIKVPVTEEVTENVVEQPTEEAVVVEEPKYTEAEFNQRMDELLAKKLARREAKIRKEYEDKFSSYRETEEVLKAGLGVSDIKEATNNLREFYRSKGVEVPDFQQPVYSEDDLKILANNEAQKIIEYGIEDVIEEVDRLAEKGIENMSPREKLVFQQLATHRKNHEDNKELAEIGVTADALQDADFIEFAKDLNPNLSVKQQYEKYLKYRPKKELEVMGSMKNTTNEDTTLKEFYSLEEAKKFTDADYDKNPGLFEKVVASMPKWKK